MPSTVYDIRLRYTLDDRAKKGLKGIEDAAGKADRATGGLSGTLGRLGAVAAGAFGLNAGYKALIGFNSGVEDTKIQIAGMLALARKSDLTKELSNADRIFRNLQERAKTLPGTTQEYAKFAGMITQPIIDAGLGMRDLEDLTVNSVVAARALGIEAEVAARDIDQALRGMYRSVDAFSGKILGSMGYKGEDGRARFNALSAEERAAELKRALMQKQLSQLAAAQGQTFSGVLSTLQDSVQQFFGKVGLPLFKAITAEVKRWNEYLDKNQGKVERFAKTLAEGLVDGFRAVKDAVSFLIDHKDTLVMLGKLWLASKGASMVGGMIGAGGGLAGRLKGPVGGLGGAAKNGDMLGLAFAGGYMIGEQLRPAVDSLIESISKMAGTFDYGAAALEAKDKRIQAAMDALDRAVQDAADRHRGAGPKGTATFAQMEGSSNLMRSQANLLRDMVRNGDIAAANSASSIWDMDPNKDRNAAGVAIIDRMTAARKLREQFGGDDLFGSKGLGGANDEELRAKADELDRRARSLEERSKLAAAMTEQQIGVVLATLTPYQRDTLDQSKAQTLVMQEIAQALANGTAFDFGKIRDAVLSATDDPTGAVARESNKSKKPPKVNVTIQRIEVKSDDPDRFAFGLVEAFRDAARNPSAARGAFREG